MPDYRVRLVATYTLNSGLNPEDLRNDAIQIVTDSLNQLEEVKVEDITAFANPIRKEVS